MKKINSLAENLTAATIWIMEGSGGQIRQTLLLGAASFVVGVAYGTLKIALGI